jgi:hypothetical protein
VNPAEQIRRTLAEQRNAGLAFDDAWPAALAEATRGGGDRSAWRDALRATEFAWRCAYERRAPRASERALVVAHDLAGVEVRLSPAEVRAASRALRAA